MREKRSSHFFVFTDVDLKIVQPVTFGRTLTVNHSTKFELFMTPISSKWKAQGRQTDRQTDRRTRRNA